MPEVSRFFGIVILMFYNDHNPPHFHVRYGSQRAVVDIATMNMSHGRLSPRARGLVTEWAARHQHELLQNWRRARKQEPLTRIEPLE